MPGLDAVRGLAVVGMIVVNVGPATGSDEFLQSLHSLPAGRASVLFVVVAGISMTLAFARGVRIPVLLWRAAVLLALGVALLPLPHEINIILPVYSGAFVCALAFRFLSTRVLLTIAGALLVIAPIVILAERIAGVATVRAITPGDDPVHVYFLSGPYPLAIWIVPFILGMVLGRLDLSDRGLLSLLARWGLLVTVIPLGIASVATSALGTPEGWELLWTAAAHGQMPLWMLSAMGSAVVITAGVMLVWDRVKALMAPCAVLGRTALSAYVAHALLLAAIRPLGEYGAAGGLALSTAIVILLLGLAVWYERIQPIGPLERLASGRWLATRIPAPV